MCGGLRREPWEDREEGRVVAAADAEQPEERREEEEEKNPAATKRRHKGGKVQGHMAPLPSHIHLQLHPQ